MVQELSNIGFDDSYKNNVVKKYKYKNLKIFSLKNPQIHILKQTALSVGADCATNKNVLINNIEYSDVILGGSYSQLKKIADKLKTQPFSLKILAKEIENQLVEKTTKTKLVGILNLTSNSFSDGGQFDNTQKACEQLNQLIKDGTDLIDIGAESTKPGATAVDSSFQIEKIKPILEYIKSNNINIPISIDTRSAEVADFCIQNGASIINDVSGLKYDKNMVDIIAKHNATVIIQHSINKNNQGSNVPEDTYNNVIDDVFKDLYHQTEFAKSKGITNIIIDVGIGFDKTLEDNFKLFNRLEEFKSLGYPVMIGISRKSLLNLQNSDNTEKDLYTLALNTIAIEHNIDFIRVHNVKIHKCLIDIYKKELL